jgi:hypothetical protein
MITEALVANPDILPVISLMSNAEQGVKVTMNLPGVLVTSIDVSRFKQTKEVRGRRSDYVGWIMRTSLSELSIEERTIRYFVRCTNLFANLALGRNQLALKFLIESPQLALSYGQILALIKEKTLPYFVRARYFTLMKVLYVDRDPQQHTPQIHYTRVWSKLTPEESDLDMSIRAEAARVPICTTGFVDLIDYMVQEFPQLADCADVTGKPSLNKEPMQGQLELVKAEISVADELISFGFFIDKDDPENFQQFGAILKALFAILDIRRENGKDGTDGMSHLSLEGELRNEVRSDALKTLLRIFNLRLNTVRT